ncbi:MAG: type II secretion system protein [Patescibacteria group bacterium]
MQINNSEIQDSGSKIQGNCKSSHTSYFIPHTFSRGFTLVELIVSISIFAIMTALVVAKYGTFNQSVLLTNLAYDMALTIRTAQTYGVSVKQEGGAFTNAYGIFVSNDTSINSQVIFFSDSDLGSEGFYASGADQLVNTYALKRGAIIKDICTDTAGCGEGEAHITFKRPDPDAIICVASFCAGGGTEPGYVRLIIAGTDGSTRSVLVRKNGQISVEE